ncbi:MAG: hypothetical protein ACYTBJ_27165 [Planctomycetota bacterium]|jgi:hypothetical protein
MKNQYGLDADYFKRKLQRTIDAVDNMRPAEMANVCEEMADTACAQMTADCVKFRNNQQDGA